MPRKNVIEERVPLATYIGLAVMTAYDIYAFIGTIHGRFWIPSRNHVVYLTGQNAKMGLAGLLILTYTLYWRVLTFKKKTSDVDQNWFYLGMVSGLGIYAIAIFSQKIP